MIVTYMGKAQTLVQAVGTDIRLGAKNRQAIGTLPFSPECRATHQPFRDALLALVLKNFDSMHHADLIMDRGECDTAGHFVPAGQDRRFGFGAVHDLDTFGADAAFGPDFQHDRQRFPDVKGRDPRDRHVGQLCHRGDIQVDRIDNSIAPRRKFGASRGSSPLRIMNNGR